MEFEIAITPQLIIDLLLVLTVAWALGALFTRFGLPIMLGELLAGVIIGPVCFGIISVTQPLELLAELGIFFAMFYAGMEMDPKELVEHTEGFHGIAEFPFAWQVHEPYASPLQV